MTNGSRVSPGTYAAVAVIAAAAGFAAIYVTLGPRDNRPAGPAANMVATQQPPPSAAEGLPKGPGANPLSRGDMAAFVFKKEPEALPAVAFTDAEGNPLTLTDWKGKVVLLNLWATWCAPCRKEMPQLDELQRQLGSDRFEVVALSADRAGVEGARKFFDQIKVQSLKIYVDSSARATSALKAIGMPTTLLIDAEGREIGRLVGPAEWDGDDAKRLIQAALD